MKSLHVDYGKRPPGAWIDGGYPRQPRRFAKRKLHFPEEWLFNLDRLQVLSRSELSTVAKGKLRNNPRVDVVIKAFTPQTWNEVDAVKREIHYLKKLQGSPGVVTLYRTAYENNLFPGQTVLLLLEGTAGNLEEMVLRKSFDEVPLNTRIKLFVDIVQAVRDLEEAGVSHGELTPENILIVGDCRDEKRCSAVLCDFGSASDIPGGTAAASKEASLADARPDAKSKAAGSELILSLATILYRLISETGRHAVVKVVDIRPALGGLEPFASDPDMVHNAASLIALLSAMLDKTESVSTELVLEAMRLVADRLGLDLSRRECPRPLGDDWTTEPAPRWRILLNRLKPRWR